MHFKLGPDSSLLIWYMALWERDRLVGLVVRRPPQERKILGSNPACARIFSRSSHTSDSKIGTPVATLPGARSYRVRAGTGWPGVSILWLGEMESLICNFYLSVAAREIVFADPSLRCTQMLLGRKATNQQQLYGQVFSRSRLRRTECREVVLKSERHWPRICFLSFHCAALRQSPPTFSVRCYPCPFSTPCCTKMASLQRCLGFPTDVTPFICHSVLERNSLT